MSEAAHPTHHEINSFADIPEYKGFWSWITSIDHKQIGIMYIISALVFLLVGVTEAMMMRIQLAKPMNDFLTPEMYNQIFTMHGTTMVFFMGMPLLFGFMMYFVPLMIGARDMAFPRLNAFGFWVFLLAGFMMYFSFIAGGAPDAGWFSYAPLTEKGYNIGPGVDYWALGLLVSGIGSVATGVNLIVTVLKLRAPGMTLRYMPLFVWMSLITGILLVFAIPALNASLVMILTDRMLHASFFSPTHGGSVLLWQNYFWAFGHPEVYILILPAFGAISEIIPVFSRKIIYGYGFMVASTIAIGFLGFGVWIHHMFTTGLGFATLYIFSVSSMLIAVPTGIKIWNWLATIWGGSVHFKTPMLFAAAFLVQFTIGGLSGIAFAAVPLDWQLTDSYFVVAHFHYVLVGGTVFAMMAATYYWFPKMTGKMMSEKIGKWHFWLMLIGFNGTFAVMHILGLLGMPRRVYTYPDRPLLGALNLFSSCFGFVLAFSILLFIFNLIYSFKKGKTAGANPWNAWTLEWATSSPPHPHNFETVPPIRSNRPLWDLEHPNESHENLTEETSA